MTQPEKIEHIINKGCEYLGIMPDDLHKDLGTRSKVWDKKRYLIIVLNNYTLCTLREIADLVGYKTYRNAQYHRDIMIDLLSSDTYGSNKVKMGYKELLEYLGYEKE